MPIDSGGVTDGLEDASLFDERLFFAHQPAKAALRNKPAKPPSMPANAEAHYHGHRERLRNRSRDGGDAALADYDSSSCCSFV
jgi:DNA repair protein RadC